MMENGVKRELIHGDEDNSSPQDALSTRIKEEDEVDTKRIKIENGVKPSRECPYLDTIDRHVLDFDFEKLCSVSLSRINVYACLVCGKYFQGRGRNTHAYVHSVSDGRHRVYLNLETKKFYCLPDNYEIIDSSLADIIYVLNPIFSPELIKRLETSSKEVRAYCGSMYIPGIVGLNNMKANDFCNVVIQALSHVTPIRNYFLEENNYKSIRRPPGDISFILVQRFGELIRKLWNPKNFKAHVSPHEMLQAVSLASKKTFQFTEQGDSISFISWLLNALHMALGGTKKPNSSIIYKTFLGGMRIHTRKIKADESGKPEDMSTYSDDDEDDSEYQWKTVESPFLYLTTELPPMPLFRDENYENIIPQVSLYNILTKFNGEREMEYKTYKDNFLKKFEITRLPPFVILYIKRFTKNTFYVEKNHTIVNFPIKSIEFGDILAPELKEKMSEGDGTYDLLANIVHDGDPKDGTYKVHILHKGSGKWFEMQDLHVDKILPEILPLSEAYIQIYERRSSSK
ncbi:ubiquitin carboxyl-terminal hydrolase 39 [Lepeophtheirus salmonis]|nr:U4/U6.U5 tri-snRNP-associated protein 2-like [Lepeophtheirus salmonis]